MSGVIFGDNFGIPIRSYRNLQTISNTLMTTAHIGTSVAAIAIAEINESASGRLLKNEIFIERHSWPAMPVFPCTSDNGPGWQKSQFEIF